MEAVVAREIDECAVLDDPPGLAFADDGGLHVIVEVSRGTPPSVSKALAWQRRTAGRS